MTLAHDSRRRIRMWNKLGSHGEGGGVGGVTSNYVFLPFLPLFLLFCLSLSLRLSRSPDENSTNQLRINGDSDNTTSNSPFNTTTGQQEGPTQRCCTLTLHWSLCMWTQEKKKKNSILLTSDTDLHFLLCVNSCSLLSHQRYNSRWIFPPWASYEALHAMLAPLQGSNNPDQFIYIREGPWDYWLYNNSIV